MKKGLTILVLLMNLQKVYSQNLVPNPSFEEFDTCPNSFSQMDMAISWYSARPTADYFNVCAPYYAPPISCVNVPSNSFGYRTAASGSGYAGVISRESGSEYRENIGSPLLEALQIGVKYYISFKVSSGGQINPQQWCGINKLGTLFSTVRYDSLSPAPICNNCAQVFSDSIITDTLNWIRITGYFIADSNYSYINIGRFNSNSLTDSTQITGTTCYAYYYIDDVCVSTDSVFTYNYSWVGINNLFDRSFKCYPNPFTDFITVQGEKILRIEIYNSLGEILKIYELNNLEEYTFDLSRLSKGIYHLQIVLNNFISINKPIVKL
jgi:hypothetical protein